MKTFLKIPLFLFILSATALAVHAETGHDHGDEPHEETSRDEHGDEPHEETSQDEHGDEEGGIQLSATQLKTAGIVVEALQMRDLAAEIRAPGEVRLNAYRTTKVTSRITAQVIKRHVTLGEQVVKKQALVTLSSVEMADAQGALMVADREWLRVQKLGAKVISDRRYTEARVAHQLAYAKVAAFGMTQQEILALLKSADASKANGEFQLLAARAGTVVQDDFIEGAIIEPGYVLLTLSDESTLWIDARLTPQQLSRISQGSTARIQTVNGWLTGTITQLHHTLDEDTRTIAARITVANPDDRLHPGEFVEVRLQSDRHQSALAIPDTAVLRSPDGDWQIMVEQDEPGEFDGVEVDVKTIINGMAVIEGIPAGTRVVTQGAFFVQSELAKSGFSVHNH